MPRSFSLVNTLSLSVSKTAHIKWNEFAQPFQRLNQPDLLTRQKRYGFRPASRDVGQFQRLYETTPC